MISPNGIQDDRKTVQTSQKSSKELIEETYVSVSSQLTGKAKHIFWHETKSIKKSDEKTSFISSNIFAAYFGTGKKFLKRVLKH